MREESVVLSLTAYANIAVFIGHQCRAADLHGGTLSFSFWTDCCVYYYLVLLYNTL